MMRSFGFKAEEGWRFFASSSSLWCKKDFVFPFYPRLRSITPLPPRRGLKKKRRNGSKAINNTSSSVLVCLVLLPVESPGALFLKCCMKHWLFQKFKGKCVILCRCCKFLCKGRKQDIDNQLNVKKGQIFQLKLMRICCFSLVIVTVHWQLLHFINDIKFRFAKIVQGFIPKQIGRLGDNSCW